MSKIKDSSEVDGRKILLIYEVESLVFKTLDAASFHLKDLECLINDSTDGLRVITPEKQEARQIVEGLSTNRVVLNRRIMFNASQREHLIAVSFSRSADHRANAKFNLNTLNHNTKFIGR